MVGKDGGVRVMDFGVARQIDAADGGAPQGGGDDPPADDALPVLPASQGDLSFTRTGELVGTPLYMAPEQFQGERTDARTDQFSFCVTLYQALYRKHPFAGDSLDVLVTRVLTGDVQPPPARNDVPAWLRRVLLRGMAAAPVARWPSMAVLTEELGRDPARARRRWGVAAGIALLVGAATFTLVRGPRRAESLCRGGPARLAGIWEPPGGERPRRDAVEAALARAGGSAARDVSTRVAAGLDRYAAAWLGMYRDACEATHLRGEQSAETLELRMSCLDERRAALGALTTVLAGADKGADAAAVSGAVDAVNGLPPLDRCADLRLLREPTDSPRDEETRRRAQDIRARLATAQALHHIGRYEEAMSMTRALVAEARSLGYRSLIAEALVSQGELLDSSNFQPAAVPILEEGVWTALAVKRDDLATRGASDLTSYLGDYLGRRDEGLRWARLAGALLDRLGPGHDLFRAWLYQDEGNVRLHDDLAVALDLYDKALALKEKALPPDHPDIAITLKAIAETLHRTGRDAEALDIVRRAREIDVRAYGPTAVDMPHELSNEGEYLVALGRAKEAVPVFQRALVLWGRPAEQSILRAFPLTGLGQAWLALGRPDEARPVLEEALALRAKAPRDVDGAETRFALARSLWATPRDRARADELALEARDIYAHLSGATGDGARAKAQLALVEAWVADHR
jgi:eukaryotic-like serine/threonine-protein kinase